MNTRPVSVREFQEAWNATPARPAAKPQGMVGQKTADALLEHFNEQVRSPEGARVEVKLDDPAYTKFNGPWVFRLPQAPMVGALRDGLLDGIRKALRR